MGVLFFFIDGFGLGEKNKKNPLYTYGLWKHLIGLNGLTTDKIIKAKNYIVIPTDTHLGIPGIPQSATGQTCLLTGIDVISLIGGHVTGFPGEILTKILLEQSLLKKLKEKGLQVTSANAYSRQYFMAIEKSGRRMGASTLAIQAADIHFRMLDDLEKGNAVFMDITHHILKTSHSINEIHPAQAASNLSKIVELNHFTLFEYFWTDYIGHNGKKSDRKLIIRHLNGFLKELVKIMNLKKNTIIICSDHGNVEDISTRGHTENKVPTLVFSKNKAVLNFFGSRIKDLVTVPNAILEGFESNLFYS